MAVFVLESLHSSSLVLVSPVEPVARMIKTLGQDQLELLLKHHAAQQIRNMYDVWEQTQVVLGLILGGCLYFATQKRILSLALCGVMLAVVLFQFFAVTPELAYRGLAADFAQGQVASSAMVRLLLLYQLLVISEGLKLLVGGILTSYLFSFRTSRRKSPRPESEVGSSVASAG
jgi:hypothetical protein